MTDLYENGAKDSAKGGKALSACEDGRSSDPNLRPKHKQTAKREGLDRGSTGPERESNAQDGKRLVRETDITNWVYVG